MGIHHVGQASRPGIGWVVGIITIALFATMLLVFGVGSGAIKAVTIPRPSFESWDKVVAIWNDYFHPRRITKPGDIVLLERGEGGFEVGAGIPTGCLATPLNEVSFETFPAVARSCVYTYAGCTGPADGYAVWQHGPAIQTFRVYNGCGGTVFIHTLTR